MEYEPTYSCHQEDAYEDFINRNEKIIYVIADDDEQIIFGDEEPEQPEREDEEEYNGWNDYI